MKKDIKTKEKSNSSTENYQLFFESNRDSITLFKIDAEGIPSNFIEANEVTTQLFGYTKKELMSLSIIDIEIVSEEIRKKRNKTFLKQKRIVFETIIKNKKGEVRNVEIETVQINNQNEVVVMNITRDITEKKQLEDNLINANESLTSILEAIPDLLFEVGIDGRIHYYQAHRKDLLAVDPAIFMGKLLQEIIPPEAANVCLEAIQEANKNGWSAGKQYSLDLPHGKYWFELSVSLIKKENIKENKFIVLARDITIRKLTEESLRNEKERNRTILELVGNPIFLKDNEHKITFANKPFYDLFGLDEKNVIGYTLAEKVPLNEMEHFFKIDRNVLDTGVPDLREEKLTLKGVIHTIITSKTRFIDESGNKSLVCSIYEISDRKKAEDTLKKTQETLTSIFNLANSGIILTDLKGNFLEYNDWWLKMVGFTAEEFGNLKNFGVIHPDDIEVSKQWLKKLINGEIDKYKIEERYVRKDKTYFWGETSVSAIKDKNKKTTSTIGIVTDITERKHNQEKIKQLSRAVEQSPVAIVITNTKGEIEYVNPKFIETTGYTTDEVVGKNPNILKSGYTSDEDYKKLWETISAGNEWFGEFQNKKKNGSLYWELTSISPIINSHGKITHYIAIKEDITERKQIELELINAKDKAEESDRLKLAFLANMSHEIRTPMNGILGFTELLKTPGLTSKVQQEFINIIEKSGKRMLSIINDIINISKIESGQIEVSLSETNINEQIEYLHTFFTPEAIHKKIKLVLVKKLSQEDTIIKSDLEKIYAILTNLIKNAIKFTDEGTIEFGCEKKGNILEFFVKDSGIGISDSQKTIIFERFRQANETLTRIHEGSGLGLAISKAYVEMLGGKLWVESKERKGSTFYFTIPIDTHYQPKKVKVPKKIVSEIIEIKKLKILIVEDDNISKLLITIAVKPFSKEILKVSTGLEAIESCRNNPDIDLVLMDINMPEMGGYEATEKIREFNKEIVIIAQTANGMQSDRDKAIAAGCTDYISKPVNIANLSNLIHKHFEIK